jgi:hypothetical protein
MSLLPVEAILLGRDITQLEYNEKLRGRNRSEKLPVHSPRRGLGTLADGLIRDARQSESLIGLEDA